MDRTGEPPTLCYHIVRIRRSIVGKLTRAVSSAQLYQFDDCETFAFFHPYDWSGYPRCSRRPNVNHLSYRRLLTCSIGSDRNRRRVYSKILSRFNRRFVLRITRALRSATISYSPRYSRVRFVSLFRSFSKAFPIKRSTDMLHSRRTWKSSDVDSRRTSNRAKNKNRQIRFGCLPVTRNGLSKPRL